MTSRERRVFKILYAVVVPLGVLLAILVSMRAWTYNLKDNGAASFWPIVVMFGVLFFPIAVGVFAKAAFDLWSARASTHWLVTDGHVTESTIEVHKYTRRGWIGWDTVHEYLPKVTYAYEAAGGAYKNDLTAFGLSPLETREEAERMLRGYPLGAAVVTAAIPFGVAFMMVTHRPL